MSLSPRIQTSPLEVDADLVEEANTYVLGEFLAIASTGTLLADNRFSDRRAVAFVVSSDSTRYWIVTSSELVSWPSHGQGAAGTLLYLGESGAPTSTKPKGSSVYVIQEVAMVWDSDHVLVFPQPALVY